MSATKQPQIGDQIHLDIAGGDTEITVDTVPDEQPLSDDGIFFIVDQFGDQHMCELDADSWATVAMHALTPEQFGRAEAMLVPAGANTI